MINLILGPPGTGKTTHLLRTLQEVTQKTPLHEIAYISFTKAAVTEAIERAKRLFSGVDNSEFTYFRTLHSLCYKLLNLKQGNVLTNKMIYKFQDIMGSKGIEVKLHFDEDSISIKNIPIYLQHLSVNLCQPLEHIHYKENQDISFNELTYIVTCYEDFKKHYNVLDFNDMLKRVAENEHIKPLRNIKVVFLDEAQDLTSLQWKVFKKVFRYAKKIFIAGDDDQSIYEWAGVNIKDFLTITADNKKVLDRSYRLPKKILNFSNSIIKNISNRYEKTFTPTNEDGEVKIINSLSEIERTILDKKESWFFLVRNIFLATYYTEFLTSLGVPFLYFGKNQIVKKDIDSIVLWERYRTGNKTLTKKDRHTLESYASNISDKQKPWFTAFDYLDSDKVSYYRAIKMNGYKLSETPKIEITTIHRVKGREAQNVVLLSDFAKRNNDAYDKAPEQEHRTFYVAATRAKKRLFIVEPYTQVYYKELLHYERKTV